MKRVSQYFKLYFKKYWPLLLVMCIAEFSNSTLILHAIELTMLQEILFYVDECRKK